MQNELKKIPTPRDFAVYYLTPEGNTSVDRLVSDGATVEAPVHGLLIECFVDLPETEPFLRAMDYFEGTLTMRRGEQSREFPLVFGAQKLPLTRRILASELQMATTPVTYTVRVKHPEGEWVCSFDAV